jgi:hypothetical protein
MIPDEMEFILDWCLHESWRLGSPLIAVGNGAVLLEVQVVL